ncbi:MAG: flagellar brake protein [Burkholderiales bacterium]
MIRLRKADLVIGRSIPFPLFDRDRHLLLPANSVIESEAQLAEIAARGLFREPDGSEPKTPDTAKETGRYEAWTEYRFEDLKLPIGTRLSVQKLDPGDDTRYTSHLVGILKDASVVVEVPAPGGELAMFRQGQAVLLRIFNGTRVFAFTANVLFVRYSPKAYMHIQWPKSVEGHVLRARNRVKVRLIAAATATTAGDAGHSHAVVTEDLSAGGARIISMVRLGDIGTEVDLAFRLRTPIGEGTLRLHARIRTEEPSRTGGKERAYGVEFVDMEPLELLTLEGYVHMMEEVGPPA